MGRRQGEYPYSIRCLRAIQELAGGPEKLAEQLGVKTQSLMQWSWKRKIPQKVVLKLLEMGHEKFSAEELLGRYDVGENG